MNRHMRGHAKWLNIKTTHLASLTAVFHSKKRSKPPAASHSHPLVTDTNRDNSLTKSSGQVTDLEDCPVPMSQLSNAGVDDHNGSDSDEMSDWMLEDFNSDEFKSSDEEGLSCKMRGAQVPLGFELSAAKAGNVLHRHEILMKN